MREKKVSTSTLAELVEVVLKNNAFTFVKKTLKELRGTAIGTKFVPRYSILFMAKFEEKILREVELRLYLLWQYIQFRRYLFRLGTWRRKTKGIY